jgi:hypothetical protein
MFDICDTPELLWQQTAQYIAPCTQPQLGRGYIICLPLLLLIALQVCMARKQWEASEEPLSAALAAAEAAGGEAGPALAPVLLLLGYGYARSARVMFAEGMLREAAKVLGATEPTR